MTADERQTLKLLVDQRRRQLVADEPQCSGCGCHIDERTAGCRLCNDRHRRRRRRALTPAPRPRKLRRFGPCVGCGCPVDGETVGCAVCRKRHWMRHMRKRWDAA